jgi:hypothetical protein
MNVTCNTHEVDNYQGIGEETYCKRHLGAYLGRTGEQRGGFLVHHPDHHQHHHQQHHHSIMNHVTSFEVPEVVRFFWSTNFRSCQLLSYESCNWKYGTEV